MKLTTAMVIAGATCLIGVWFNEPYLWIPASMFAASVIEVWTRRWVASDRLGSSANLSMFMKFILTTIGFYAMFGQLVCIGLIIKWFFLT